MFGAKCRVRFTQHPKGNLYSLINLSLHIFIIIIIIIIFVCNTLFILIYLYTIYFMI